SDDLRDHKTIEHIYPQNPRNPEWTNLFDKYSSKEKNLLRHSIGNLLPLSHPKNSSFQNKPFSEKIGKDKSVIGYKYGSLSEIEVSNELT
ncbi:HNH endonuclease family protein, partial [Salmonella enterica]